MLSLAIEMMECGLLPDPLIRLGIRRLLAGRLNEIERRTPGATAAFLAGLQRGPVAEHTDAANRQHYELPAEFFERVLGRHRKYSCCLWLDGIRTLDEAEEAMLDLSCRRAGLSDGQTILDLGCGWGSLSLWAAERYPKANILAMSNSTSQRLYIQARASERGLANLEVVTADINTFEPLRKFDRIVSVEMFEHLHNYRTLFDRLRTWLTPEGKVFVHVFSHRQHAYAFNAKSEDDWIGKYFFTGGIMPSRDLFGRIQHSLTVEESWHINGRHYQRTCEAWLARHDLERDTIMAIFKDVYGSGANRWFQRWRMFFLACAELFAYRGGEEWGVSHYRFGVNSLANVSSSS
ncbi:SAM-dependent methyltransferase [Methylococcus mesophilus]|uniref:SAM-dependent methyltransferase n=1 Tax=Methylococcus mesophilus TaxID=2993564 RepID=UPI00224AED31|nr:cyclopropane-fatty-acyl-phospholipid synthase family protein [Methylococcus mesophilus]UZR30444.1 cyclopropane-fatty-acyl-phospholipid synthase [Methylococcus mesophilus]